MLLIIAIVLITWDWLALFTKIGPAPTVWVEQIVHRGNIARRRAIATVIDLLIVSFIVWQLSATLPFWIGLAVELAHYAATYIAYRKGYIFKWNRKSSVTVLKGLSPFIK